MKGLNLHRLCKNALQVSLQRNFHSGYVLSARQKRKMIRYTIKEPGIQNQKELYEDDGLNEIEPGEDDFINEESVDFGKLDYAYDEDQRDKRLYRMMEDRRITRDRYFAPPRQPQMLTCNEIQCIKYLHENDPENWDVRSLSESFPATPDIIKKILKASYKLTPERAKKKDEVVYKNWDLLAEGKLEADPKLIEHCKKFINKREILLDQIKNTKFYLPEVKEEPEYNGGEMSKILLGYEKRLEQLQKERGSKMLPETPEKEKKPYLELLHEEVEKVMSKRFKQKESTHIRKIVNTYAKDITLDELENKTIQRAKNRKKISLTEKAILESKFGRQEQYITSAREEVEDAPKREESRKFSKQETFVKMKSGSESYKLTTLEENLPDLSSPDERTLFANESSVGDILNKIKNPVETKTEEVPKKNDTPRVITDEEKEHYEKEVEELKNTPFWKSDLGSKEKAELEMQKRPLETPVESQRIMKYDVKMPDNYPLKIPVPKSKRGSGLTFRVKDCFYDDDGEFLYRVPGLILEKANS